MFCSNCGKKILDEIKFCPFCGVEVSEKAVNTEQVYQKNEKSTNGVKEELKKSLDVIKKIEAFMEEKEEIEGMRRTIEQEKKK